MKKIKSPFLRVTIGGKGQGEAEGQHISRLPLVDT
jgi:hypothetical protein